MALVPRIESVRQGAVLVVRFRASVLADDRVVRETFDQITLHWTKASADELAALILDFQGVNHAASLFWGRLIPLQRRLEMESKELRLCGLDETLTDTLRVSQLHRVFKVDRNESEALARFPVPAKLHS